MIPSASVLSEACLGDADFLVQFPLDSLHDDGKHGLTSVADVRYGSMVLTFDISAGLLFWAEGHFLPKEGHTSLSYFAICNVGY